MAYTPTYTVADIDDIVIDFVATYGAQFVTFAALIALLVIGVWFVSRTKKLGRLGM